MLVAPSGTPTVASPVEGSVVLLAHSAASTTASAERSPGGAASASGTSCGPPRDCVTSRESSRASADPVLPRCSQVYLGFLAIGFLVPFRQVCVPGLWVVDVVQYSVCNHLVASSLGCTGSVPHIAPMPAAASSEMLGKIPSMRLGQRTLKLLVLLVNNRSLK